MLKHKDPEVRSLTLLIQLFGRDVLDQLREAGFASPLAIARAGPEMLAEQGGIALPLARRIVAVAMETEGIGELPDPQAGIQVPPAMDKGPVASAEHGGDAAGLADVRDGVVPVDGTGSAAPAVDEDFAEPGARRRRRPAPGDRRHSAAKDAAGAGKDRRRAARRHTAPGIPDREAASGRTGGSPDPPGHAGDTPGAAGKAAPDPGTGVEIPGPEIEMSGHRELNSDPGRSRSAPAEMDRTLDDSDPFVDDVALISWMGFNARSGIGRPSSIAVADEILDPVRPPDEPVASMKPALPSGPPSEIDEPRHPGAARPPLSKGVVFTLPGSFWSYGRRRVPPSEEGPDR